MALRQLSRLVVLRRAVQVASAAAFLYLFFASDYTVPVGGRAADAVVAVPVKLFFQIDPLLVIAQVLADKTVAWVFLLGLPVLVSAFLFNRAFCGWVCPFGALHQLASLGRRHGSLQVKSERWKWRKYRNIKYIALFVTLAAAPFAVGWAGWLDPFSFLNRGMAVAVHPLLGRLAGGLAWGLDQLSLQPLADAMLSALRGRVIPFDTRFFLQTFLIGGLFAAAVFLNRVETRFWCRYVCPLGALLGLCSRRSAVTLEKAESRCIRCMKCVRVCQGGDQPLPGHGWIPSECHFCGNCADVCPVDVLHFRAGWRPGLREARGNLPDLNRRAVLSGLAAGLVTVPLQTMSADRLESASRVFKPDNRLIRPPGACGEERFQALCVKCGACMKACPTNALQPASWQGGVGAMWTPVLVPRIGFCDDRCTLCGQVCPTGAIRRVTIDEKLGRRGGPPLCIGLAHFDRNRCLPWALGKPCIVCEEVCPSIQGKKAIQLVPARVALPGGKTADLRQPFVDHKYCIGCGICENKCPVADGAAVFVTSAGETRSRYNRISAPGTR